MRFAASEVDDDEPRAAHLARQQHQFVLEQRRIGDESPVALGDEIAPVRLLRRLARRDHDLEIGRAGIGADEEAIAVVHDLVANSRHGAAR